MNCLKHMVSILFVLLLVLVPFSSCVTKQNNSQLTVFCTSREYTGQFFNTTISEYEKLSGAEVILWEQLPPSAVKPTTEKDWMDLNLRLKSAVMAGEGPDVFVFEGSEFYSELYKMIEAGIFLDFDPLIEKDSEFKLDDYEKTIMDVGYYSGRRYILPLTYSVPNLVVNEDKMKQFNVNLDDVSTYKNLLNTALRLHTEGKSLYTDLGSVFYYGEYSWSQEAIDFENKKLNLDVDTFDMFMQYQREEINLSDNYTKGISSIDFAELTANEDGLFFFDDGLMGLTRVLSSGREDNSILILPIPNSKGNHTACVTYFAMIPSSSKNIEGAWEFVKLLLGDDFQKQIYMNYMGAEGVGVKSSLIDYNIEHFTEMNSSFGPIPEKYIEKIKTLYKNYDNVVIPWIGIVYLGTDVHGEDYLTTGDFDALKVRLKQYYTIWFSE